MFCCLVESGVGQGVGSGVGRVSGLVLVRGQVWCWSGGHAKTLVASSLNGAVKTGKFVSILPGRTLLW